VAGASMSVGDDCHRHCSLCAWIDRALRCVLVGKSRPLMGTAPYAGMCYFPAHRFTSATTTHFVFTAGFPWARFTDHIASSSENSAPVAPHSGRAEPEIRLLLKYFVTNVPKRLKAAENCISEGYWFFRWAVDGPFRGRRRSLHCATDRRKSCATESVSKRTE